MFYNLKICLRGRSFWYHENGQLSWWDKWSVPLPLQAPLSLRHSPRRQSGRPYLCHHRQFGSPVTLWKRCATNPGDVSFVTIGDFSRPSNYKIVVGPNMATFHLSPLQISATIQLVQMSRCRKPWRFTCRCLLYKYKWRFLWNHRWLRSKWGQSEE